MRAATSSGYATTRRPSRPRIAAFGTTVQHCESAADPGRLAVGGVEPPPRGPLPLSDVGPDGAPRGPPVSVPVVLPPLDVPAALGAPVTAMVSSVDGGAGSNIRCSSPTNAAVSA